MNGLPVHVVEEAHSLTLQSPTLQYPVDHPAGREGPYEAHDHVAVKGRHDHDHLAVEYLPHKKIELNTIE